MLSLDISNCTSLLVLDLYKLTDFLFKSWTYPRKQDIHAKLAYPHIYVWLQHTVCSSLFDFFSSDCFAYCILQQIFWRKRCICHSLWSHEWRFHQSTLKGRFLLLVRTASHNHKIKAIRNVFQTGAFSIIKHLSSIRNKSMDIWYPFQSCLLEGTWIHPGLPKKRKLGRIRRKWSNQICNGWSLLCPKCKTYINDKQGRG